MNLGDRVMHPASGTEAIATRLEIRLQDRLEHRLEGGLHHPVAHGRDPQPTVFPAALGDHHLPHRLRVKPAGLEIISQLRQEALLAHDGRDVTGGTPVHPGRASPSVAPDPRPGVHQDRRVIDEVVQIIKPTVGIVGRPLMQLGLDSQYSRLGQLGRRPRSVGIHRRPPAFHNLPANSLPPFAMWTAFPSSDDDEGSVPYPEAISRRRACPPPATNQPAGRAAPGRFPRSPPTRRRGRRPPSPEPPPRYADIFAAHPSASSRRSGRSPEQPETRTPRDPAHIHQV